jgi:hypothetical protein
VVGPSSSPPTAPLLAARTKRARSRRMLRMSPGGEGRLRGRPPGGGKPPRVSSRCALPSWGGQVQVLLYRTRSSIRCRKFSAAESEQPGIESDHLKSDRCRRWRRSTGHRCWPTDLYEYCRQYAAAALIARRHTRLDRRETETGDDRCKRPPGGDRIYKRLHVATS